MKRGLVFTLCAAALVVGSSVAQAQNVQLSLNLRYTDPANPAEGGIWRLVAKTDDADGIAAISAYISGINAAGIAYGPGAGAGSAAYPATTAATIGAILNGGNPFAGLIGGNVNVVYGQDTAGGPIVADVGQGAGTPGNTAADPLKNVAAWNNAAVIASGTFGATRPAFATSGANSTDANTLAGTTLGAASQDAAVTLTVRGDSLNTLNLEAPGGTEGVRFGDRNRDFAVSITTDILPALAQIGQPGVKGWDDGDFTNNGVVSITTDILPALAQIGQPGLPPAASSVPEPASIVGLGISCILAAGAFRKRFA